MGSNPTISTDTARGDAVASPLAVSKMTAPNLSTAAKLHPGFPKHITMQHNTTESPELPGAA